MILVTGTPAQYDHDAWRAIFDVVRPTLPPGRVERERRLDGDPEIQLIHDDELE